MIKTIIPGVILQVDGEQAILAIAGKEFSFLWNCETETLFTDIDVAEPVELLAILAQA